MNEPTLDHSHENRPDSRPDDGYDETRAAISAVSIPEGTHLFTTSATGLYDLYLSNLLEEARQHYTCSTCGVFFDRYAGLVTLTSDGEQKPILDWTQKPIHPFFEASFRAISSAVKEAKITGVFATKLKTLGTPATGMWDHFYMRTPEKSLCTGVKTASDVGAAMREDHRILCEALQEYPKTVIEKAVKLLEQGDVLYRSERILGHAQFLKTVASLKGGKTRSNQLWYYAAHAPAGFCHVRSGMIGTLLDDLKPDSGGNMMPIEDVQRRFADKMHPLKYQRPTAGPSEQQIERAERIFESLQLGPALERRFARIDECQLIWPIAKETQAEGGEEGEPKKKPKSLFGHLLDVDRAKAMVLPECKMTWREFHDTVLPKADSIEYLVRQESDLWCALVTAEHADAPPILQWDSPERRNPLSWYVYTRATMASRWNLSPGYRKVTGICYQPSMWNGGLDWQGESVLFLLEGCKDTQSDGLALFPECLRGELHEVRKVVEAHSRKGKLGGFEQASACGIRLCKGRDEFCERFMFVGDGVQRVVRIDRYR